MGAPYKTVCRVCGEPRDPASPQALCAQHLREYNARHHQKSRAAGAVSYTVEYRRVDKYRAEAARQGATEAEGWWCAIAAEARFQQHGRGSRWLVSFIAAELAALRAMPPRCQPEWQPPAETWEPEETA